MANPPELPDIAGLLAEHIRNIPRPALPFFIAQLERLAAARYRGWAEAAPEAAEGLRECAAREEEIAARVEHLLPVAPEHRRALETTLPRTREAYAALMRDRPLREQWRIQSAGERQGAGTWRTLAARSDDDAAKKELEACARLEEANAAHLDELLRTGA